MQSNFCTIVPFHSSSSTFTSPTVQQMTSEQAWNHLECSHGAQQRNKEYFMEICTYHMGLAIICVHFYSYLFMRTVRHKNVKYVFFFFFMHFISSKSFFYIILWRQKVFIPERCNLNGNVQTVNLDKVNKWLCKVVLKG